MARDPDYGHIIPDRDALPFPPLTRKRTMQRIAMLHAKYEAGWSRGCVGAEHMQAQRLLVAYWAHLDAIA